MEDPLYMTAEEAAQALGVEVATIYTYVSRGQIRSQRAPGERRRRYWRTDVIALKGGDDVLPDAPDLRRTLVESSAITLITPEGHYYRGKSALELAKTATLEEVAALLWQAPRQDLFTNDLPRVPAFGPGAEISSAIDPLHRAIALLFNVEQANPRAYDLSPQGYRRSGVDVLRCVAAAGLGAAELSAEPMHHFAVRALNGPESLVDVVRYF
ncbi:MAG: citrate synthase, partial [Proteobacteria bacterium]|nr:citrate synthase [Pseudomonadota bacterium]